MDRPSAAKPARKPSTREITRQRCRHDIGLKVSIGQVMVKHRFARPNGKDGFHLANAKKELMARMKEDGACQPNDDAVSRNKLILDHRFLLRCARRLSEYEGLIQQSLADSRWKRKPRHSLSKYVVGRAQFGDRRARLQGGGRKRKFPDAVAKLRSRTKHCQPRRPHAIFKSPFERV